MVKYVVYRCMLDCEFCPFQVQRTQKLQCDIKWHPSSSPAIDSVHWSLHEHRIYVTLDASTLLWNYSNNVKWKMVLKW